MRAPNPQAARLIDKAILYHEGRISMKHYLRRCALGLSLAAVSLMALQQQHVQQPPANVAPEDPKLPNGKSQKDEILKAERDQNIKDAQQLADLAQQLQQDLEKEDRFVLSMSTLKKTEDIEKLARKIRSRLRHN